MGECASRSRGSSCSASARAERCDVEDEGVSEVPSGESEYCRGIGGVAGRGWDTARACALTVLDGGGGGFELEAGSFLPENQRSTGNTGCDRLLLLLLFWEEEPEDGGGMFKLMGLVERNGRGLLGGSDECEERRGEGGLVRTCLMSSGWGCSPDARDAGSDADWFGAVVRLVLVERRSLMVDDNLSANDGEPRSSPRDIVSRLPHPT